MSKFGFLYELYDEKTGKRILTQNVSGTRMGVMLEHVAKTVADQQRQLGNKVVLKMLKARLNEDTVLVDPKRMDSLNTLVTMAVEHYHQEAGKLVVETRLDDTTNEKLVENLRKVLTNRKKVKKLAEALKEDEDGEDEKLKLPTLKTGDTMLVGKWKNRRAEIKGFDTDEHNQPVAKTNKGDQQIFKGRIEKLMQTEPVKEAETPAGTCENCGIQVGFVHKPGCTHLTGKQGKTGPVNHGDTVKLSYTPLTNAK
jgi:hypothetical protein